MVRRHKSAGKRVMSCMPVAKSRKAKRGRLPHLPSTSTMKQMMGMSRKTARLQKMNTLLMTWYQSLENRFSSRLKLKYTMVTADL
jgi:hypothetical protein